MTNPREAIYAALFALLAKATGVTTSGRRLVLWGDVAPADQPALFLREVSEDASQQTFGTPAKWTLRCEAYLYWRNDGTNGSIPAQQGNALRDAIEAAMAPAPAGSRQTLGGVVTHCWIDGKTIIDDGALDQQAIAVIPITILTT